MSVVGICIRMLPWTARAWYLHVVHLALCRSCCFLCVGGLSSSCWCKFPSGVRCTHLLSPVLEARSVLLQFTLSRRLSRSRRMRCSVEYYILCTSSVGLRRGCGLSFSIRFWIKLALEASFRRVSSLGFSLVLPWVLYRCLIVDISFCNSWGFLIFLLEGYHSLSVFPCCRYSSFR